MQQDAVEAAVMEADAILVMLVESVHRISFSVFAQRRINPDAPTSILMQDYHQLDIWNPRAMDYAVAVYKFAASLPEQEKYNLASPLRRAVTSVPLNIAEGCGTATNTGVQPLPELCLSLVEGGRHGLWNFVSDSILHCRRIK